MESILISMKSNLPPRDTSLHAYFARNMAAELNCLLYKIGHRTCALHFVTQNSKGWILCNLLCVSPSGDHGDESAIQLGKLGRNIRSWMSSTSHTPRIIIGVNVGIASITLWFYRFRDDISGQRRPYWFCGVFDAGWIIRGRFVAELSLFMG